MSGRKPRPIEGPDPMPKEFSPSSGRIEPRLVRGDIPRPGLQTRKKKKSPWSPHIDLAKQFPARWDPVKGVYEGGWIEVANQLTGGPRARKELINRDRTRIKYFIDHRCDPLDRFQTAIRCDPGTWADLRLYVRFLGTLTPEEDVIDRKQRRGRYDAMMRRREEKAAERELERRRKEAAGE